MSAKRLVCNYNYLFSTSELTIIKLGVGVTPSYFLVANAKEAVVPAKVVIVGKV